MIYFSDSCLDFLTLAINLPGNSHNHLPLLMHNVLKWSNTFEKSCSKCCKIFEVCLTNLGHYALKG